MKTLFAALSLPVLALGFALPTNAPPEPAAIQPFHCQVPCGIYGDTMRIDMLLEDAATIEKGMNEIAGFQAADSPNINQMVRWTVTKDEHAQKVQDQVSAYWLAQRIKLPAADADAAARAEYAQQLELLHRMTVFAMKCKQTTDVANVASLREAVSAFSGTYFSKEDLEHLREHQSGEQR
jgi:nickel superoxide dismutase